MTTVAQPYVYPVANIPGCGGGFTGQMSDHLSALVEAALPTFWDQSGFNSDETNVIVTGVRDLDTDEKAVLDGLVDRVAESFIVTIDGGTTDIGEPGTIDKNAGLDSATTITLKFKDGNGNDSDGHGEVVKIIAPRMPISKTGGAFDANGKLEFTVGSSLERGTCDLIITSDKLPQRHITANWN